MPIRLSTKGLYAVRAMTRLASQYNNRAVSIKTLAEEERIPSHYLEQLMTRLRRNGLLISVRGPGGGYKLAKSPDQISLGEVIRVLEGNVRLSRCVQWGEKKHCIRERTCIPKDLWNELSHAIQKILNSISFRELINGEWKLKNFNAIINE